MSNKTRRQQAELMDKRITKIAKRQQPKFKSILANIKLDVVRLYKATGRVNARSVSQDYLPNLIALYGETYRKAVQEFGYDIRNSNNIKVNKFYTDYIKKNDVVLTEEVTNEQINNINAEYELAVAEFIRTYSQSQSGYVVDTNAKLINNAITQGEEVYNDTLGGIEEDINKEILALAGLGLVSSLKLTKLQKKRTDFVDNKDIFIGNKVASKLTEYNKARSEMLSQVAVGSGEAFARDEEAKQLNKSNLVTIYKRWNAILDSRTRPAHVNADDQIVEKDDLFFVGGEYLKYPRDLSGSPKNIMNCRCTVEYFTEPND
jgi:uncharacterized protein with gpF-like domain